MNKKITCVVIDDEALARKLLTTYIEKIPYLELKGVFKNPIEAMPLVQTQTIDVLFLDIQMPQISGINFLKTLVQRPLVVFTTAYEKYAIEGFNLDVVDYLLKPFAFERFLQAVQKVTHRLSTVNASITAPIQTSTPTKNHILVKSEHRIHRLRYEDILYIQSMQAYVAYHTSKERILSLNTMKKLEEVLPKDQFIRIHKSYIIAKEKVELLEGNQVIIQDTKLPIGASYREMVLRELF